MEQNKTVGIWIRVSTEDAAKGDSPEHHEKRARLYAESKGWNVATAYHLEALTGKSVMAYAETKRMLEDIRNGAITGLIFSKLARFARNTKELLEFADIFREEDAALISLEEAIDTSTPAGRLFYTMIAAMAQWEREEIVSRIVASIPIRAKMGKNLGGQPSLGYKWEGKDFVIDEQHAPVRKLIYELFLKQKRKKAIARTLNEQGYRTRNGKKFTDTTVARLLRDPTAKGERRLNFTDSIGGKKNYTLKPVSEWVTVTCPAIISPELWDECNCILDQIEKKRTKLGPQPKTLLAGYVQCDPCKKKMYVYHKTQTPSYTCPKCKTHIHVEDLDFIFKDQLKEFLLTNTSISEYLEKIDVELQEKERLLSVVREERNKTKKKSEEMVNMRIAGEWNRETFIEHFRPLEERIMQIDNQLPELEAEIDFMKIQHHSSDMVLFEARDLYSRWDSLEFESKRTIVEIITDMITVGKQDIHIKLSYLPTKSPKAANPAQEENDKAAINQNPVKGQPVHYFALPFSTLDKTLSRLPKSYPQEPKTVGEYLLKVRLDRQLTKAAVAKQIGVTPTTIAVWEQGKCNPEVTQMKNIIAFLGFYPLPESTTLAGQIEKYRQVNGLTLEEFGKLLGIDGATVWTWENERYRPGETTFQKINDLINQNGLS